MCEQSLAADANVRANAGSLLFTDLSHSCFLLAAFSDLRHANHWSSSKFGPWPPAVNNVRAAASGRLGISLQTRRNIVAVKMCILQLCILQLVKQVGERERAPTHNEWLTNSMMATARVTRTGARRAITTATVQGEDLQEFSCEYTCTCVAHAHPLLDQVHRLVAPILCLGRLHLE